MAIERRKGGLYWYDKKRVGRRVRSIYRGRALPEMAQLEACLRMEEAAKREERDALMIAERDLALTVRGAYDLAESAMVAALEAHGYHRHKGQWRKRRS